MSTKILNKSQAEAVYSAMCALNNVGGTVKVTLPAIGLPAATPGNYIRVYEDYGNVKVRCSINHSIIEDEFYEDQAAFATAYGIDGATRTIHVPARYWDDFSDRAPVDTEDQMPIEVSRSGNRVAITINKEQSEALLGDAKFYAEGNTDDTPRAVLTGAKRVVELLTKQ